jgi:hypothetical protein
MPIAILRILLKCSLKIAFLVLKLGVIAKASLIKVN